MQLSLIFQTWCNFILHILYIYFVIDRVYYDRSQWIKIREKILGFYFTSMLDIFLGDKS